MLYLLHSSVTLGTVGRNSASHYLGWCEDEDLPRRIRQHMSGKSDAAIVRAFVERGATLSLVAVWPGKSRDDERRMKSHGHLKSHCYICTPLLTKGEHSWRNVPSPGKRSVTLNSTRPKNSYDLDRSDRTRSEAGGWSRVAPAQARSTSLSLKSGRVIAPQVVVSVTATGGRFSPATAPPPCEATCCAGTRLPSLSTGDGFAPLASTWTVIHPPSFSGMGQ